MAHPKDIQGQEITFYSQGSPIWGKIFIPKEHKPGEKRGAWVLICGYNGRYDYLGNIEDSAKRLASIGYVALGFEHRTFGRSAVPDTTPIADPFMRCIDIQNAITYLQTRSEVDDTRIGLLGYSFGGFTAPYVAAFDDRAAAVVCVMGIGDGYRWLRSKRTANEWHDFIKELDQDRRQRVLTGKGRNVDPYYILPNVGADKEKNLEERRKGVQIAPEFRLESAECIIRFKPENYVHLISPRPILYVHSPVDKVAPVEEVLNMYEKSKEPKTLWLLPGNFFSKTHYELYEGCGEFDKPSKWKTVIENIMEWMKENMPNEVLREDEGYHAPKLRPGYASRSLEEVSWLRRDSR